jgi:hypothetical protein
LWASALALITPWPLIVFTPWSVQRIFLIQLAVFVVAGLIFSLTPLRLALVPRALQRARATAPRSSNSLYGASPTPKIAPVF